MLTDKERGYVTTYLETKYNVHGEDSVSLAVDAIEHYDSGRWDAPVWGKVRSVDVMAQWKLTPFLHSEARKDELRSYVKDRRRRIQRNQLAESA